MTTLRHRWATLLRVFVPLIAFEVGWPQVPSVPDAYNDFPAVASAEGFRGRTTRVEVSFNIFFDVDDTTYVPVKTELARILAAEPIIESKAGIVGQVVSNYCLPRELNVKMGQDIGRGTGGTIQTMIEVSLSRTAPLGDQVIRVLYPVIDTAMERLSNRPGRSHAVAAITVTVWASPEAKQAALRKLEDEARQRRQAEEEQRIQAQKEQEEAQRLRDEEARRQEALASQRTSEARKAAFVAFLHFLPEIALGAVLLVLCAPWFWPTASVTAKAGQHEHLSKVVPARHSEGYDEPGTILQTAWARGLLWRRHRLKVETFVSEDAGANDGDNRRLDLLISVGQSVRRGIYLAKTPNGPIRVRVES
jgi:hypothetical protein